MKKMIIALAAGAAALCAGAQENERRDRTAGYRGAIETSVARGAVDAAACAEWLDGSEKPCPKAAGIVSDVPSEAELKPQNWGILEIKQ